MEDYLRVIIPYLHTELVSYQALSPIQTLAQALPPSSTAFFECRLGYNQFQVDFEVGFSNPKSNSIAKHFLAKKSWNQCGKLLLDWTDSASVLNQFISSIFLEFDLPNQFSQLPTPCFFLALNQNTAGKVHDLMKLIFDKVNYPVNSCFKSALSQYFDCLPPGSVVTPIGLMLSRPNKPIKLGVEGVKVHQLLSYLAELGWIDTAGIFSSTALALEEISDSCRLSFDIYDNILPTVGLECFLTKQYFDKPRWQILLKYLVEIGVCTPAKRDALLDWLGFSQQSDSPELWPINLAKGDLFLGSSALSVFWREISHIKVVYDLAENQLSAKGYLSFGHSWLNANPLPDLMV